MKTTSTTAYLLKALIPYTEANVSLAFKPAKFFRELERLDKLSEAAARNAYYRAIAKGLIKIDQYRIPRLTTKGYGKLKLYQAKQLTGASLLLIFDIPEGERSKRNRLRTVLKELSFKRVQKSVWQTKLDCLGYIRSEINDQDLHSYVEVY